MIKNVEILAPAGSYKNFIAAINAGADAVYLGGDMFGARAYANNFTKEEIIKAIEVAHLYGRKVYLTVNTLLKNKEIERHLYDYIMPLYQASLDAVIVQDMGVFLFLKDNFPGLSIHASTQMTLTGANGVKMLKDLGATRIVTARELSLDEIKSIHKNVDVEIESFVHGALCYCYSGQCLFSSLIGQRSGNRGRCAQPCRLMYSLNKESKYYLSPKDMCSLHILPDILEAGVYSLKIEGRMKSAEYTALVTSIYRKYVDLYLEKGKEGYKVDEADVEKLMDIFNRGNFTKGYYVQKNGSDMLSLKRPNHQGVKIGEIKNISANNLKLKLNKNLNKFDVLEISEEYTHTVKEAINKGSIVDIKLPKTVKLNNVSNIYRTRNNKLIEDIERDIIQKSLKLDINGSLRAILNEPLSFSVSYLDKEITLESEIVGAAISQSATVDGIKKQLLKTGDTPFTFAKLDINMSDNIFIPNQQLNAIRREALQRLYDELTVVNDVIINKTEYLFEKDSDIKPNINVLLLNPDYISVVLEYEFVRRIYLECEKLDINKLDSYKKQCNDKNVELFIALPYILRHGTEILDEYELHKPDGYLVRNYEEMSYLLSKKCKIVTDTTMHVMNDYSIQALKNMGVADITYSLELNYNELRHLRQAGELVVYSYIPLMISAQCINKTAYYCDGNEKILVLKDRYSKEFKVRNVCKYCYNIIYNSLPMQLLDRKDKLMDINCKAIRYDFIFENEAQIRAILENKGIGEYTRGHFERGVE